MTPHGTSYQVTGRILWPVRPNVQKVSRVVGIGKARFIAAVKFPPIFFVARKLKLYIPNYSLFVVEWRQMFHGSVKFARKWAATDGGSESLLTKMESVQNAFIDVLKTELYDNYDVHCIRHFGPLDWPYYEIAFAGKVVHSRIGSSLGTQFRSMETSLDCLPELCGRITFENRTLQRAVDLSQCGYPTESALLAAAVLDSTTQKFLMSVMKEQLVSTESAEQFLRSVTTRRMATYLDAVLKLAVGKSLREDDPHLFSRVKKANENRNNAIHNGKELSRRDAYEACSVTFAVVDYLRMIRPNLIEPLFGPCFF